MNRYAYDGPVMRFKDCVESRWKAETMALSEQKARNNLTYRWKKLNGYVAGCKIELPGKIRLIDAGGDI